MSADNGIYIARFVGSDGNYEYRVAHAQAIENCDYSDRYPKQFIDATRVLYFGDSKVYKSHEEALERAREIERELVDEDPYEMFYIEYGICDVCYDTPFPDMSMEEANRIVDEFWRSGLKKLAQKELGELEEA